MKIHDCITRELVTVSPKASAKEAFGLMKSMGIRHLIVVDNKMAVGIVTDRDLRRPRVADVFKSWDELYRISDEFQVEDIMSTPITAIDEDADVKDAAKAMVQRRIGALPVTDRRRELVGIITESDLLRALVTAAP